MGREPSSEGSLAELAVAKRACTRVRVRVKESVRVSVRVKDMVKSG